MKRFLPVIAAALILSSCGIYSFSGTSIQPDVKTIHIPYVEYKALTVNPSLSNQLTEALKDKFRKLTRLEEVDVDADLDLVWTALQIWAPACGFKLDPSFTRRMGQRVHEFMLAHPLPQH